MKTQDWVEMSVFFDNDICPMISASGVSLSVIILHEKIYKQCVAYHNSRLQVCYSGVKYYVSGFKVGSNFSLLLQVHNGS